MLSCRRVVLPALSLCALVAGWVASAEAPPPLASADTAAARIFQRTGSTGLVVVVVRDGEVWMQSYGQTAPGSGQKPAGNSLIRLCSLSKILATDLLVKLAVDHVVAFTDPLQKFAPVAEGQDVRLPTMTIHGPALRALTLGDLATHTAGLPREIAYPPVGMAHFTFPDEAFRWQWLPTFRLRTSPGTAAHYSNIGFDLLGDALSHASGRSYAALFAERTARPLQLTDTTLQPSGDQCARLMGGAREPLQCTDTQAAAGSGGMYSTADDMVRVLRYLLHLPGVPVWQNTAATAMYVKPASLRSVQGLGHAGIPTGIGLGWIEINGDEGPARIVQKTGGGAGFQTYLALNPARHAGVFLAATQGRARSGANLFREANAMLIALAGLPPVPEDANDPERERVSGDAEALSPPVSARHRRAESPRPKHGVARMAPRAHTVKRKTAMVPARRGSAAAAAPGRRKHQARAQS